MRPTAIALAFLAALDLSGCAGTPPRPRGGTLLIGTAVRTINPAPGVPLVGYPGPRPNTGVALDLCARAAVFGTPGKAVPDAALVVIDRIHVDGAMGRAIRQRAAAAVPGLDPSTIMVAATHTHSGPAGWDDPLVASAAEAVAAAWNSRVEVVARIGRARANLGHNRRVVNAEGKAKNEWKDPEGRHDGFFNPDIPFVVFDDAQAGEVRAVLVSYGCHPVVLGPGNTKVSADYPGYTVRALESATGARTAIFVTGAAANINPRECLFGDPERARPMGEALAAEVEESLHGARPLRIAPAAVTSVALRLSLRPEAEKRYADRLQDFPEGRRLVSEVQVLRLGELAIVTAPGELVAEIGTAIRDASPLPHTIVVSCANDHLGYLVTDRIWREGGHEANSSLSTDAEQPLLAAAREALARAAARDR